MDNSGHAVGIILLQGDRPTAFESKKLDIEQYNYILYECKLHGIVNAHTKWQHYLYGSHFEIEFDQENIKWISSQKDLKGRKAHSLEMLQEFDFELRYHRG